MWENYGAGAEQKDHLRGEDDHLSPDRLLVVRGTSPTSAHAKRVVDPQVGGSSSIEMEGNNKVRSSTSKDNSFASSGMSPTSSASPTSSKQASKPAGAGMGITSKSLALTSRAIERMRFAAKEMKQSNANLIQNHKPSDLIPGIETVLAVLPGNLIAVVWMYLFFGVLDFGDSEDGENWWKCWLACVVSIAPPAAGAIFHTFDLVVFEAEPYRRWFESRGWRGGKGYVALPDDYVTHPAEILTPPEQRQTPPPPAKNKTSNRTMNSAHASSKVGPAPDAQGGLDQLLQHSANDLLLVGPGPAAISTDYSVGSSPSAAAVLPLSSSTPVQQQHSTGGTPAGLQLGASHNSKMGSVAAAPRTRCTTASRSTAGTHQHPSTRSTPVTRDTRSQNASASRPTSTSCTPNSANIQKTKSLTVSENLMRSVQLLSRSRDHTKTSSRPAEASTSSSRTRTNYTNMLNKDCAPKNNRTQNNSDKNRTRKNNSEDSRGPEAPKSSSQNKILHKDDHSSPSSSSGSQIKNSSKRNANVVDDVERRTLNVQQHNSSSLISSADEVEVDEDVELLQAPSLSWKWFAHMVDLHSWRTGALEKDGGETTRNDENLPEAFIQFPSPCRRSRVEFLFLRSLLWVPWVFGMIGFSIHFFGGSPFRFWVLLTVATTCLVMAPYMWFLEVPAVVRKDPGIRQRFFFFLVSWIMFFVFLVVYFSVVISVYYGILYADVDRQTTRSGTGITSGGSLGRSVAAACFIFCYKTFAELMLVSVPSWFVDVNKTEFNPVNIFPVCHIFISMVVMSVVAMIGGTDNIGDALLLGLGEFFTCAISVLQVLGYLPVYGYYSRQRFYKQIGVVIKWIGYNLFCWDEPCCSRKHKKSTGLREELNAVPSLTTAERSLELKMHATVTLASEYSEIVSPPTYFVMYTLIYFMSPNAHNFGGIKSNKWQYELNERGYAGTAQQIVGMWLAELFAGILVVVLSAGFVRDNAPTTTTEEEEQVDTTFAGAPTGPREEDAEQIRTEVVGVRSNDQNNSAEITLAPNYCNNSSNTSAEVELTGSSDNMINMLPGTTNINYTRGSPSPSSQQSFRKISSGQKRLVKANSTRTSRGGGSLFSPVQPIMSSKGNKSTRSSTTSNSFTTMSSSAAQTVLKPFTDGQFVERVLGEKSALGRFADQLGYRNLFRQQWLVLMFTQWIAVFGVFCYINTHCQLDYVSSLSLETLWKNPRPKNLGG